MKRFKKRVANWCLKHLMKSIRYEDVLEYGKLSKEERMMLTAEAETIMKTRLWKRLREEMGNLTREIMFSKSKDEMDMLFGKSCLYMLDIMTQKVDKLANMRFQGNDKRPKTVIK